MSGYDWFYIFTLIALVGGYLSFGAVRVLNPSVMTWCEKRKLAVYICLGLLLAVAILAFVYSYLVLIYLISVPLGINAAAAVALRK